MIVAKHMEKSPEEYGLESNIRKFDDLYNPVMVFLEEIETRLQSCEFTATNDRLEIEWKLSLCQVSHLIPRLPACLCILFCVCRLFRVMWMPTLQTIIKCVQVLANSSWDLRKVNILHLMGNSRNWITSGQQWLTLSQTCK